MKMEKKDTDLFYFLEEGFFVCLNYIL